MDQASLGARVRCVHRVRSSRAGVEHPTESREFGNEEARSRALPALDQAAGSIVAFEWKVGFPAAEREDQQRAARVARVRRAMRDLGPPGALPMSPARASISA